MTLVVSAINTTRCVDKQKGEDKAYASASNECIFGAFDSQQCLTTPLLTTSEVFYKRQLWSYNLTINLEGTAKCFMWHERIAERGANKISSCLYHLSRNLYPSVKQLIIYSDSCAGLNKNFIVAALFFTFVEGHLTLDTIDYKFLVPGHTHMECDSDYAAIERVKKKNSEIHHPSDWLQLVREVKKKITFEVIKMIRDHFYKFDTILETDLVKCPQNMDGNRFLWNELSSVEQESKEKIRVTVSSYEPRSSGRFASKKVDEDYDYF